MSAARGAVNDPRPSTTRIDRLPLRADRRNLTGDSHRPAHRGDGNRPARPDGVTVGVGDPAAQARRCLEIIRDALGQLGAELWHVHRTRTVLTRIDDREVVARVHGEFVGESRPANTIMPVGGFIDPRWLVEFEADAWVDAQALAPDVVAPRRCSVIIRFFRAIVHEGREEEFRRLFLGPIRSLIRAQEGVNEVSIGLPHDSSPREFSMMTCWRNMDALRAFAGDDWQRAVIHPDEAHLLQETFVHHYIGAESPTVDADSE